MTATSSARTEQKGPRRAWAWSAEAREPTGSDGEGRPAAAATRGVRVVEREARFLEIALVVQRHAVQVLGAEAVYEAAHAAALDHDVVGGGLVLNAQAVAEPRAAARQHADPQAGGLGRHVLLRHELPDFRCRLVGDGERDGGRVLRRRHDVSSDQTGS